MTSRRTHFIFWLLGCGLIPAPVAAQASASRSLAATIDSLVEAVRAADRTPGITVAVVRGQDTLVMTGYGLANVEDSVRATSRSVFHIASLTKQFTAAAVMRLVEQGKLRLDGNVGDYLPDYSGPARRVTLHQLLTHTAGVPNYTSMGARFASQSRLDLTHEQMLAIWGGDSLVFTPGTRWEYSNSGYYLLGMIIEKVSGETYAQHLRRTQWEPLGLTQTTYCSLRDIIPYRARSYGVQNGVLFNAPPMGVNTAFAAGGLCSTPRDLVRWTRALHGGQVVSAESFSRMITPVQLANGTTNPYGYGLTNARVGNVAAVQHGGGINGFSANLAHYPMQNLTIVVIVNGPTSSSTLGQRIAYLMLGLKDPAAVDEATTPAQRARYVGTYQFEPPSRDQLRIFEKDGRLMAEMAGSAAIPLRFAGGETFYGPDGSKIEFTFVTSGGRVTGFTFAPSGSKAQRVK